jgi:putative DNA primase/helicase
MIELTSNEISAYYRARLPKLRQAGREWRGPCPVHHGKDDNFAINPINGTAFCHSKCGEGWDVIGLEMKLTDSDFRSALQSASDLIGRSLSIKGHRPPQARRSSAPDGRRKIIATYDYVDEQGEFVSQVVRYRPKAFKQRSRDQKGKWLWKKDPHLMRLLYRLPQVLKAEIIYVVEGEKDVHTLETWGLTATTNPEGSGKWNDDRAEYLRGKWVVIVRDNDEPGWKHGDDIANSLQSRARGWKIIDLPGLDPGEDVTDWKDKGRSKEEFLQFVDSVEWAPKPAEMQSCTAEENDQFTIEPYRFRVDERGVFAIDPEGKKRDHYVSPPLEIVAATQDRTGRNHGKLVRFTRFDGRRRIEQTVWILDATLAGDGREGLLALIDRGFRPRRDRASMDRLKDFIYYARAPRTVITTPSTGWNGSRFVLPNRTFGTDDAEEIMFQGTDQIEHFYHKSGSVEQWRENVSRLCIGNSRLVFAVSAAFAAPLLELLHASSSGFHFRGRTSTGKTTATVVGGSVVGGGGKNGFLDTWNATASGLEARAGLHNDCLLCLDEIGEISEKIIGEVIYALGNGRGKMRMNEKLQSVASTKFKLIYISTGEIPLDQILSAAGKHARGGQEVRMMEILAEASPAFGIFENLHEYGSPQQFSDVLIDAAKTYYGTAFDAYLGALCRDRSQITQLAKQHRSEFAKAHVPRDVLGEVWRGAVAFGLVAAAGHIATELGITGWPHGEALRAAAACFFSWVEIRGGFGSKDFERSIEQIRGFLLRNTTRFQNSPSSSQRLGYR